MKITVVKDLDIKQLYLDICYGSGLADFDACDQIGLAPNDFTPRLLAKIFTALAEEAERRDEEEDDD